MTVLAARSGALVLTGVVLALLVGCASAPVDERREKPGASPEEVARLRAVRDRAFEDIEGPRTTGGAAAKPAPSRRSAARSEKPSRRRDSRDQPEWVPSGFSSKYPIEEFIVGVGSCKRVRGRDSAATTTAEDRARSSLAKQIRVHLQSELQNSAYLVTEASSGKTDVKRDTTVVAERIRSRTDMKLEAVAIADRWFDKKENTYWTLAVLERATAAEAILDQMSRLTQQVMQEYDLGADHRKHGRAFLAVRHLNRGRKDSLALLGLRSQLRAISPAHAASADLVETDERLKSLWKEAALAAEELRFAVIVFAEVDGKAKSSAQTESGLSTMLRRLGLNTVKVPRLPAGATFEKFKQASSDALHGWLGTQANCLLLGTVGAESIGSELLVTINVHFYEAKAELAVIDLADARVVASAGFDLSNRTRCSNRSPARAAEAAMKKAARLVSDKIEEEIVTGLCLAD